jgi:hypothetical protein
MIRHRLCATGLPEEAQKESHEIHAGLIGYFVGRNLPFPALGERIANVIEFARQEGVQ